MPESLLNQIGFKQFQTEYKHTMNEICIRIRDFKSIPILTLNKK